MEIPGQLLELLSLSAAEAFIQVGVFVGAVLLLFQYINYRQQGALIGRVERAAAWQPAIGALLGLIPGCGPQILFVTMFARGLLPFAALLAKAISQDGDALFPLLVLNQPAAIWATVVTTVPALVLGLLMYALETRTALGVILGRWALRRRPLMRVVYAWLPDGEGGQARMEGSRPSARLTALTNEVWWC